MRIQSLTPNLLTYPRFDHPSNVRIIEVTTMNNILRYKFNVIQWADFIFLISIAPVLLETGRNNNPNHAYHGMTIKLALITVVADFKASCYSYLPYDIIITPTNATNTTTLTYPGRISPRKM